MNSDDKTLVFKLCHYSCISVQEFLKFMRPFLPECFTETVSETITQIDSIDPMGLGFDSTHCYRNHSYIFSVGL